jgi:hypothetical protein
LLVALFNTAATGGLLATTAQLLACQFGFSHWLVLSSASVQMLLTMLQQQACLLAAARNIPTQLHQFKALLRMHSPNPPPPLHKILPTSFLTPLIEFAPLK